MKFQILLSIKILRNSAFFRLRQAFVVFAAPKCQNANNCWHFDNYEQENVHEQELLFTRPPGQLPRPSGYLRGDILASVRIPLVSAIVSASASALASQFLSPPYLLNQWLEFH